METLIGAGLIGVAIVIAAALYGRTRPAVAAVPSVVVGGAAPPPGELELTRRAAERERSAERPPALEAALARRSADLDRREAELERRDQHLRAHAAELERLRVEREAALERI